MAAWQRGAFVGLVIAVRGVAFSWFVMGRTFHQVVMTDREVAVAYAVPPRVVRLPATKIMGATWQEKAEGPWALTITTRDGRRCVGRKVAATRWKRSSAA